MFEMSMALTRKILFYHYGYTEDTASILTNGLHAFGDPTQGAFGTLEFHTSGSVVQQRFSLPHAVPPNARYTLSVDPAKTQVVALPPAEGGGHQVYFPKGVPPEDINPNVARLDP